MEGEHVEEHRTDVHHTLQQNHQHSFITEDETPKHFLDVPSLGLGQEEKPTKGRKHMLDCVSDQGRSKRLCCGHLQITQDVRGSPLGDTIISSFEPQSQVDCTVGSQEVAVLRELQPPEDDSDDLTCLDVERLYDDHLRSTRDTTASFSRREHSSSPCNEQVCYGMIENLEVKLNNMCYESNLQAGPFPVVFRSQGVFQALNNENLGGDSRGEAHNVISNLYEDPEFQYQAFCTVVYDIIPSDNGRKRKISNPTVNTTMSVIVYGPRACVDEVGDYFRQLTLYLQDPFGCDRRVRYINPHRLCMPGKEAPWTDMYQPPKPTYSSQDSSSSNDLLTMIESTESIPETEGSPALATPLKRHQKQALTFMLNRERGWNLEMVEGDVWSRVKIESEPFLYRNNITGESQATCPPAFQGGILADQMGLGKTLTVIALIASDQQLATSPPHDFRNGNKRNTLIVVPPNLLATWEGQLRTHICKDAIRWQRHHGRQRINTSDLKASDIVLTTYQTITSESKKHTHSPSFLLDTKWSRIVLDEGHVIRNGNTKLARAMCALKSERRWIVTGTPIQNRPADIASALKFLRCYPYHDPWRFEQDIMQLQTQEHGCYTVSRLKTLLKHITLRRSSIAIKLPPRTDTTKLLEFSKEEAALYATTKQTAVLVCDCFMDPSNSEKGTRSYLNLLQQINDLRMICNLGVFSGTVKQTRDQKCRPNEVTNWTSAAAQRAFKNLVAIGDTICYCCEQDVTAQPFELQGQQLPIHLAQCLKIICSHCAQQDLDCGCAPKCNMTSVSVDCTDEDLSPGNTEHILRSNPTPTKVKALLQDLRESGDDTKSVVFTSWTSTLDLIEGALKSSKMQYIRYDGSIPQQKRNDALSRFQNDPTCTIALFTIACGAVGLDLTVANHAYLMEPHWNPTVEDQALARIYRLGQLKEVKTTRYIIRDTFEGEIIKKQKEKKQFAAMLLSSSSSRKENTSSVANLRALLN